MLSRISAFFFFSLLASAYPFVLDSGLKLVPIREDREKEGVKKGGEENQISLVESIERKNFKETYRYLSLNMKRKGQSNAKATLFSVLKDVLSNAA